MITESELLNLSHFGRVHNNLFSDFDKYDIIRENGQWSLWLYCEVTGDMIEKIIDIESIDHLREIYESLENEELT